MGPDLTGFRYASAAIRTTPAGILTKDWVRGQVVVRFGNKNLENARTRRVTLRHILGLCTLLSRLILADQRKVLWRLWRSARISIRETAACGNRLWLPVARCGTLWLSCGSKV